MPAIRCLRPTAPLAGDASIAAGPSSGSPSSSTATGSITRVMRGSMTAAASVRRAPRGDEFRRYTYGDVFDEPRFMLVELRVLLPAV